MQTSSLGLQPPPTPVLLPDPFEQEQRAAWPVVLAASLLTACAVTGFVADRALEESRGRWDEAKLGHASAAFSAHLGALEDTTEILVRLLVDDARVREPLAMPEMNEATLADLMTDMARSGDVTIMAVLSASGRVRAVAGEPSLHGVNLATTQLVRSALESGTGRATWLFPGRLVVAAAAPIRLGEQTVGLLLVARQVSDALFRHILRELGVEGGLVANARVVPGGSSSPALAPLFVDAAGADVEGPTAVHAGGERYLALARRVDDRPQGGKVVWMVPRHAPDGALSLLSFASWLPAGFAALGLIVAWALSKRAGRREA